MGDHSFAHLETTILVLNPQGKWVRQIQCSPAIVAEMRRRPKSEGSWISILWIYSS